MKPSQERLIEIIAVGEELLTPYFLDTNSLFITSKLNDFGFSVHFKTVCGDNWDHLCTAFRTALGRAHLIFSMGGLGPTQDDRTREAAASVLGKKLTFKPELMAYIENRFQKRGILMPEVNKRQAYILEGANVLNNNNGTAPGQWCEMGEQVLVLLPGPPHELKPMFNESVEPRLAEKKRFFTCRKILKTTALTESRIETLIYDLYPKDEGISLTVLARPGEIELHLFARSEISDDQAEFRLNSLSQALTSRLGQAVFSSEGNSLEEETGILLKNNGKTLATAESCTGGYLSHRITNVPGSSAYFLGGIVAYDNKAKVSLLNVPESLLLRHGAVSAETAASMASGIRLKTGADFGLSVTGIAGPDGGTAEKPVGLVYTSLSGPSGSYSVRNIFLGNRDNIKFQSSQKVLDMLRREILGMPMPDAADEIRQ